MKLKVRKTDSKGDYKRKPLPGEKGFSGSSKTQLPQRQEERPLHLDKRWQPLKGDAGKVKDQDTASVKRIAIIVQHEVIRCFRDGHLYTGDFQRWVRANAGNRAMFYKWVLSDLIPKSVALSVMGGDGASPEELPLVVRIEPRKDGAKK